MKNKTLIGLILLINLTMGINITISDLLPNSEHKICFYDTNYNLIGCYENENSVSLSSSTISNIVYIKILTKNSDIGFSYPSTIASYIYSLLFHFLSMIAIAILVGAIFYVILRIVGGKKHE